MRKIIIVMILALIIIGGIISFTNNSMVYHRADSIKRNLPSVVKFKEVYNKDSSDIKSLLIRNGTTGETKVTEDIKSFLIL